jgi:hypothetical protein
MARPLLRRLPGVAAALAIALLGAAAAAAPKDGQAEKAHSKAMEEAYLESRFDDAVDILQKAIDACGSSGCTPKIKGRLYIDLGTVQSGGLDKHDAAVDAFVEALKVDRGAALDPDYVKKEIQKAFDEAKGKVKDEPAAPAASSGGGARGDLEHDPHPEQKVNTPLPIHVVVPEKPKVARVVVRYRDVGGDEIREKELEKAGQAFRGNIPCEATVKEGALEYWIVAEDKDGEVVATKGSEDAPLSTEIRAQIEGKAPRWPGFAPPESCSKGTGRQCVDDSDCLSGETCSGTECLASAEPIEPDDVDGDEGGDELRRSWISLWFAPDLAMVSGDDVCSPSGQSENGFVCLRENGTHYLGNPTQGQANNVNFGFGMGPVRLGVAYDHLIGDNLTLGARLGWAFGGASATDDEGVAFIPVHVEGRLAYYVTKDPFAQTGARPYVFLGGGLAQVDVPVDVEVLENGETCEAEDPDDFESPCTAELPGGGVEPRRQTLTAYKQAGLGFAAAGFGVAIAPADPVAIHLGARIGVTFPVVVPVVAPELGVAVGF